MSKIEAILLRFKSSQEALVYCMEKCRLNREGCALTCKIREAYGIPPFSKKYLF